MGATGKPGEGLAAGDGLAGGEASGDSGPLGTDEGGGSGGDGAGEGEPSEAGTGGGGGGGMPCARAPAPESTSAPASAVNATSKERATFRGAARGKRSPAAYSPVVMLLKLLAGATIFGCATALVRADDGASAARLLAPSGRLRAAINFGNPVLAQRDVRTGEPRGVSVDLARELAKRLDVPVDFVTFDAAGKVSDALKNGAWDVAFLAIDPVRADAIAFTPPYVVIEGTYLVRSDAPFASVEDLDRDGVRITVARGSAYDLYLTRALAHAQLVRFSTGLEAVDVFAAGGYDAAAGVKQPLVAFAGSHAGVRVMPGRFMVIEQAVAIPKPRAAGLPFVQALVEELKRSGFVMRALAASGQADAAVAPPAP